MAGYFETEVINKNEESIKTEIREQILQKFANWLDDVLAEEENPSSIPVDLLEKFQEELGSNEEENDLYSIWSALTALSHETKLQGRAFKQLNETILAQEKTRQRDAKKYALEKVLDVLLDMRDRLTRGYNLVQENLEDQGSQSKGNWFTNLFADDKANEQLKVIESMKQGYHLTLMRLNDELKRLGIQEIQCLGQSFNPQTMRAVEIEDRSDVKDGSVLEVYRTGYSKNGRNLRPAEVKVARVTSKGKNE